MVTDTGLVTGASNGLANIYITSDGVQGSKSLRVVPNYQGQWTGFVQITQATPFPSNAYLFNCTGYLAGTFLPISFTFTQSSDSLSGQFVANGLTPSLFVSLIDPDGGTQITSSTITSPYQYVFNWHLTPSPPVSIPGPVNIVRTGSAGIVGGCTIDGTIVGLNKLTG